MIVLGLTKPPGLRPSRFLGNRAWTWLNVGLMFLLLVGFWKAREATAHAQAPSTSTKAETQAPPPQAPPQTLAIGQPLTGRLSAQERHRYQIRLETGQYLHLVVEQKGIDLEVNLYAPAGKHAAYVDSPNKAQGPEPIYLVAEETGWFRVEIQSGEPNAAPGDYTVEARAIREPTETDRNRYAAQKETLEVGGLIRVGTPAALQEIISGFEKAIPYWRLAGEPTQEADALRNMGRYYRSLNQAAKALETFQRELVISQALNDSERQGVSLNNIGLAYLNLGDNQKALEWSEKALSFNRLAQDRDTESRTLNNLGMAYLYLGESRKAVDHFEQALKLIPAFGIPLTEANTLNNLGGAYSFLDENQKAVDYFQQAARVFQKLGARSSQARATANVGRMYGQLGEPHQAMEFFAQGLSLAREAGDKLAEARTLNLMGEGYLRLGDAQAAQKAFLQALPVLQNLGDRRQEAGVWRNLGNLSRQAGDLQGATEQYQKALDYYRSSLDRRGEAGTLTDLGTIHFQKGNPAAARECYLQAVQLQLTVGDRQGEANTRYELALVLSQQSELRAALDQIERAIHVIEAIRTKVVSHELRMSYFATMQKCYDLNISLLLKLHRLEPKAGHAAAALLVNEQARARTLLELLVESRLDIRSGVNPDLLETERKLQQRIGAKTEILIKLKEGKGNESKVEDLERELKSLSIELDRAQTEIRQTSPRYAGLYQPQPDTLGHIQGNLLDPETILLEFKLGQNETDESYLWLVTQHELQVYELGTRIKIELAAREVYQLLTAFQTREGESVEQFLKRNDQAESAYWKAAASLSRILLGPVADRLEKKRLVIVAEGVLLYIPFAALPTPSGGSQLKKQTGSHGLGVNSLPEPLIVDHEIVYLPSISTLSALRSEAASRTKAPRTIGIVADPVFDLTDARVAQLKKKQAEQSSPVPTPPAALRGKLQRYLNLEGEFGPQYRDRILNRLPGTRKEAKAIMELVAETERTVAFDFEANLETVTAQRFSQCRYLHFATHGLINNLDPKLSSLVLSLVDEQGKEKNGLLTLQDIYNLKLPAELVVLSACQTALGTEVKGEGMIGLTRGFMYAGSPRLMASLWPINDTATVRLMSKFYRNLLQIGQPPAEALRTTQISLWKQNPRGNPFYWAGFVLQGEWR